MIPTWKLLILSMFRHFTQCLYTISEIVMLIIKTLFSFKFFPTQHLPTILTYIRCCTEWDIFIVLKCTNNTKRNKKNKKSHISEEQTSNFPVARTFTLVLVLFLVKRTFSGTYSKASSTRFLPSGFETKLAIIKIRVHQTFHVKWNFERFIYISNVDYNIAVIRHTQ
jgi:hypothetical protein